MSFDRMTDGVWQTEPSWPQDHQHDGWLTVASADNFLPLLPSLDSSRSLHSPLWWETTEVLLMTSLPIKPGISLASGSFTFFLQNALESTKSWTPANYFRCSCIFDLWWMYQICWSRRFLITWEEKPTRLFTLSSLILLAKNSLDQDFSWVLFYITVMKKSAKSWDLPWRI